MLKLLSDPTRLRILMLLSRKELCVCQIMGILGVSQSLISHNLKMMSAAGFLEERRDGKLVFYSVNKKMPSPVKKIVDSLKEALKTDYTLTEDLNALRDCEELQKKSGKCDMKTFSDFMTRRRKEPCKMTGGDS